MACLPDRREGRGKSKRLVQAPSHARFSQEAAPQTRLLTPESSSRYDALMPRSECEWIEWLSRSAPAMPGRLALGIGDDLAIVNTPGGQLLVGSDMLLDGVHFDTRTQPMEAIGRKCLGCVLSDCAAMAVRPLAVTVSVALPRSMADASVEALFGGIARLAGEFQCGIAGGDTCSWEQPLAVDVAILAAAFPAILPVRRTGARVGDTLYVTGSLGGSLLGRHLSFTPRVAEARRIAERLGPKLHAMMDISDGLALDMYRLCRASGVGAMLREDWLESVISDDARRASEQDRRAPLVHALEDGEDFELLLAAAETPEDPRLAELGLRPVGEVVDSGMQLARADGTRQALEPRGYQHL